MVDERAELTLLKARFALKDVFVNLGLNLGELRDILLAMCQLLTQVCFG